MIISFIVIGSGITFGILELIIKRKDNFIIRFIENFIIFGFSSVFIFMLTNYLFKNNHITKKEFEIVNPFVKTTVLKSGKYNTFTNNQKTLVEINYNGFEKEIVYENQEINNDKTIILDLQKGLFGYEIIITQNDK